MKKKIAFITAVFVLAFSLTMSIGCTIAWLFTETQTVTNSFNASDINIELTETAGNTFQLIPGTTYHKNPIVTVLNSTNIDVYLFVKITENDAAKTYLIYTLKDEGWTKGDGTDIPANVWYRVVGKNDAVKSWQLLVGNSTYTDGVVTINAELVTKATMAEAATAKLAFEAAAVQHDNMTAKEAYDQIWNP